MEPNERPAREVAADAGLTPSPKGRSGATSISRRRLLGSMVVVAAGIGVGMLLLGPLAGVTAATSERKTAAQGQTEDPESQDSSDEGAVPIRVKVDYFQMSQVLQVKEEYFSLRSPARLSDLLTATVGEHPALEGMVPTMMILVDGIAASPSTALENGDEVDFIPAYAGG